MKLMEIIELDDSAENISATVENSPLSLNDVRQRKRKESLGRLHNLLNNVKKRRKCTTQNDLDVTLDPNINSSPLQRNSAKEKERRKNIGRPSVILVESDDDSVETLCSENNNIITDLCLSDTSVIELSDTEDEGIVAGLVETTKERINGWKIRNLPFGNENTVCDSSLNNKNHQSTIEAKKRTGTVIELKENARKRVRKKKKEPAREGGGTSSGTVTQLNNALSATKEISRQSISYLPPDSAENPDTKKGNLRPIIIDGSNVAFGHGKVRFSAKGIEICIDYFLRRNHTEIRAFVPQFRRRHPVTVGFHILDKLEEKQYLVYTPSRPVEGRIVTSYDDRFIVEYAAKTGGIIVTRDNYQDLLTENKSWSDTINFRLLQYTFVGDMIMFPHDPLGRGGPTLDKFLKF